MKPGSEGDKPLSKEDDALLDAILSAYLSGDTEDYSIMRRAASSRHPTLLAGSDIHPTDETIHAYLSGIATDEQTLQVREALRQSKAFCEELLQIAEHMQTLESDESLRAFADAPEPLVPDEFSPEPVKETFLSRIRRLLRLDPHSKKRPIYKSNHTDRGVLRDPVGDAGATMGAFEEDEAWSIGQLREENLMLSRALGELSMLNVLTREIGASRNREAIIHRIIRQALKSVGAEQAVVNLVSRTPIKSETFIRERVTSSEHEAFHLDKGLLGRMYFHKQPVLSNDPQKDERIGRMGLDPSVRSILAVPLLIKAELTGVLVVYNKKDDIGFTEEDQRILTLIATQSAQIIENARLYGEIKKELELASAIQLLMPQEQPSVPGYDIYGQTVPSKDVGGAYFDFIPIEGDRIGICLGDVTGTGVTASLLVAGLQATLRGQTLADPRARETISRSNELLYRSTDEENFATLFYGVLNPEKDTLEFSNAGHQFPFLLSHAKLKRLETGGMVLGVLDHLKFDEDTIKMQPGDVLVMFSDGIVDAFDESKTVFGEERLAEIIEKHRDEPANVLAARILKAVKEYAGTEPQEDDQTLVVVKREQAA